MLLLASFAPILLTIVGLLVGMRSLQAALLGVCSALLVCWLGFPIQNGVAMGTWVVVMVEVLLIVGGGLLLAQAMQASGAQAALAQWLHQLAGSGVKAGLLVVHGVIPFAESLTGFGIGITIGIPLLAGLGLAPRKVAAMGLLGLCAIPWGSMGPGTMVAAKMAGVSFDALGQASAVLNGVPFVVTGMAAAYLANHAAKPMGRVLLLGALSGMGLTVAVWVANTWFGTAPAGALGALCMVLVYLLSNRRGPAVALPALARRALKSYALLLAGVLVMGLLYRYGQWAEGWRLLASPAVWLFVASAYLVWGSGQYAFVQLAWRAWLRVAPVTALFIVLGIIMAVSGMATYLAQGLAASGDAYLLLAPLVGASGGYITGSNTGANAMFAATQAQIAQMLGVNVLWFMAVHNVSAAFLMMASPGKIEMALSLSQQNDAATRTWLMRWMLGVAAVVLLIMVCFSVALGMVR